MRGVATATFQRARHNGEAPLTADAAMDRRVVLALCIALPLAGCLGGDEAATAAATEPAAVDAEEGAAVGADGTPMFLARFAAADPVDVTEWHNGTFRLEQSRRVGPVPFDGPTNAGGRLEFDITALVPRDVPTTIIAEVNAELAHGDLDLGLMVPQGEWRTGNWNTPTGGYSRFETGIVHTSSEPIVVVLTYDEAEPQPEFAYTIIIRVVSHPANLMNGIVTGVTLPADARFQVDPVGAPRETGPEVPEFALHVFGPDDAFVATFPLGSSGATDIALPAGSLAGEYVFLLSQGGRDARILVEGSPAPMRALALEWQEGELAELDAQGRGSASATFDRAPLLVGVFFTAPNVAQNVAVTMSGPQGGVFAGSATSDTPWLSFALPDGPGFTYGWGWDSLWGAPGLTSGAYEATVEFERGAGAPPAVAGVFAAFHAR